MVKYLKNLADPLNLIFKEKPPQQQPLPSTPTAEDPEVADAARRAKETARRAKGRGATVLTSGFGDTSQAPVRRATLLGA